MQFSQSSSDEKQRGDVGTEDAGHEGCHRRQEQRLGDQWLSGG